MSSRIRRGLASLVQPVVVPVMLLWSGTFLYPLQGISYFGMHPILWAYMFKVMIPELLLGLAVSAVAFIFLYPPQAALALFFNGPSGIITAGIAMVHESIIATQLLAELLLLPAPLELLFDSIMSYEGFDELVLKGRLRREAYVPPLAKIRNAVKNAPKALLYPKWFLWCLFKILLNFIPLIGPLVLIVVQGPSHGQRCHRRYFQLKGFDSNQERQYVGDRRGQYMGFGFMAVALESVPILGLMFAYTNVTGAALWAVAIERRLQGRVPLYLRRAADARTQRPQAGLVRGAPSYLGHKHSLRR